MHTWYLVSVYVHVLCAAFWIGGILFLPLVMLPGIKHSNDRVDILYKTGIRFRLFGWIALAMLALSGIGNLFFKGIAFHLVFFSSRQLRTIVDVEIRLIYNHAAIKCNT